MIKLFFSVSRHLTSKHIQVNFFHNIVVLNIVNHCMSTWSMAQHFNRCLFSLIPLSDNKNAFSSMQIKRRQTYRLYLLYLCVHINVHTHQKPKSYVLQDFTLDMYFRQFWQDPRLSFERRASLEKLVVGAEYIKLIWVPDTFFVNEKTAYFHDATTDNQFLRILHTGEILRSIR